MRATLVVLFASLGLSVGIAEFALRKARLYEDFPNPPKCRRPDLYQQVEFGYRLWPSRQTEYLYPIDHPRRLSLVSNAAGFRSSREFNQPDTRLRMLVVGDSFVFGEGVEESERFTNMLETLEPKWRVDNLGMPGYGPDLMLRALEAVGLDTAPDIVVFVLYTDQFQRLHPRYAGVGFQIPRFTLQSGQLVTVPYPAPSLWDQSRLVGGLHRAYWSYSSVKWDLSGTILDTFRDFAARRGFVPAIVFLPGSTDGVPDRTRRMWLRAYAQRHSVAFQDLTDPIHQAGVRQVFIPGNPHLNAIGHRIVAVELHRFLAGQVKEG